MFCFVFLLFFFSFSLSLLLGSGGTNAFCTHRCGVGFVSLESPCNSKDIKPRCQAEPNWSFYEGTLSEPFRCVRIPVNSRCLRFVLFSAFRILSHTTTMNPRHMFFRSGRESFRRTRLNLLDLIQLHVFGEIACLQSLIKLNLRLEEPCETRAQLMTWFRKGLGKSAQGTTQINTVHQWDRPSTQSGIFISSVSSQKLREIHIPVARPSLLHASFRIGPTRYSMNMNIVYINSLVRSAALAVFKTLVILHYICFLKMDP